MQSLATSLTPSPAELLDFYDNTPYCHHVLDDAGKYRRINATGRRWLGCSAEELIGRRGPRDFMSRDSQARFDGHLPQLKAGQPLEGLELEVIGHQGTRRSVSMSASAILDPEGRFLGSRSVLQDLTSLKQAEALRALELQLEADNRQLEEANRIRQVILGKLSHELRTPLNAVLGFAHLLGLGHIAPGSPRHASYLEQINTSGQQLLRLIDTMLDLANASAGKISLSPAAVELPALLAEAICLVEGPGRSRGIKLTTQVAPGLDTVECDARRLRQVLVQYLSNAVKFSHPGGRVELRVLPEGLQHFRIEVEDQGIGITESDQARLFRPFTQLVGGSDQAGPGAGMGLALVRQLVEAQGGEVGVRSSLGRGSVFYALLPRWAARPV